MMGCWRITSRPMATSPAGGVEAVYGGWRELGRKGWVDGRQGQIRTIYSIVKVSEVAYTLVSKVI
jgi:hypothetical protein